MKMYYTIEKHHHEWYVWKHIRGNKCIGFIQKFRGISKKECLEYCKENNINLER